MAGSQVDVTGATINAHRATPAAARQLNAVGGRDFHGQGTIATAERTNVLGGFDD